MKQKIKDRLAHLSVLGNGKLTPNVVVRDARDPKSPLHGEFDWNADSAAQKYWIIQARDLIRSFEVTLVTETHMITVPGYIRDPNAKSSDQGYVSIAVLRDDTAYARRAIDMEFARVAAILKRAKGLATVLGFEDEIGELIRGVEAVQAKALLVA